MSTPNQYIAALVTLRSKYDPCEMVSFWLTNQPVIAEGSPNEFFPIIEAITGIGIGQNQFTPQFNTGVIRLKNNRDSILFERRITDLQAVYTMQNACIKIFSSCKPIKDETVNPDKEVVFEGQIQGVNYTTRGTERTQRLSLQVGKPVESHLINTQINRDNSPIAPDRSLGQWLPMCFGENVQVTPYAITPETQPGSVGHNFLYAVCLRSADPGGRNFLGGGITKYLVADLESERGNRDRAYCEIISIGDYAVSVYEQPLPFLAFNNRVDLQKAYPMAYTPGVTAPYLITSGTVLLGSSANPGLLPPDGTVSIRIHAEVDGQQIPKAPDDFLAEAVINLSEYAPEMAAQVPFTATFIFDKPVPICSTTKGYYYSIQASGQDDPNNLLELFLVANDAATPGGAQAWQTTDDPNLGNQKTWLPNSDSLVQSANIGFNAVEFNDNPQGIGIPDQNGVDVPFFSAQFNDFPSAPGIPTRFMPDFNKVDLIVETRGVIDTPDGDATGTPNALVRQGNSIAAMLLHTYNGSRWVPGEFNPTRFLASHSQYIDGASEFYRIVDGRTYGRASSLSTISDVCRNTYSTLLYDGFNSNAAYAILAHGLTRDPVRTLTDNDVQITRFFLNSPNTVVNAMNMNYARRLDNIHFQDQRDLDQFAGYSKTIDLGPYDGGVGQQFSSISHVHYGERRLVNQNFDLLSLDQAAESVSELYLRLHDHPYEMVQVTGPYCELKELRMYDVIKLISTELPATRGTNPEPMPDPEYCGIIGDVVLAAEYRCEIIGMFFDLPASGGPTISLLLRMLVQVNDPLFEYSPPNFA